MAKKNDETKKQQDAKEALAKSANDTPSVQGDTSTSLGSADTLKALDKDPESNRSQAEQGDKEAQAAQEEPQQVGSPDAPAPTEPTVSDVSQDADRGADKPHPHLDNTDAQDKMSEVHEHGQVPEGMKSGAEASVPRTDQPLPKDQADALDLGGIRKALVTARNKIVDANNAGVRLTREQFDDHSEIAALADEVKNLVGNLR